MGVTVREFTKEDFEAVKAIVPPEWLCAEGTAEEVEAHRELMVAEELVLSTYRMVAEEDGRLLGLSLGRPAGTAPADAARWRAVMERAQAVMTTGSPWARAEAAYEASLPGMQARLKEQAGARMSQDNEYTLFFVSPDARGKGAGSALVRRWEEELRGLGQQSYYLFTDSTCTYEWYDAHGYERIAELHHTFPAPEGEEPEPAASFLYRKDL